MDDLKLIPVHLCLPAVHVYELRNVDVRIRSMLSRWPWAPLNEQIEAEEGLTSTVSPKPLSKVLRDSVCQHCGAVPRALRDWLRWVSCAYLPPLCLSQGYVLSGFGV